MLGTELFRSDGTQKGTSIFADIANGTRSSFPKYLFVYDEMLYFSADDGKNGRELWHTDGTHRGTRMVMDICPGQGGSDPSNFTIFKERLYFAANDCQHGRELWHLYQNQTTLVVKMYKDIQPGLASSNPHNFGVLLKEGDGTTTNPRIEFKMYFAANTTLHIYPENYTNVTTTTSAASFRRRLLNINETRTANATINTSTTTSPSESFNSSTIVSTSPSLLTTTTAPVNFTNSLTNNYMSIDDVDEIEYNISHLGVELWETTGEDDVESATALTLDINPGIEGSEPSEMLWYYDKLYFAAFSETKGSQLWRVHMHRDHIFFATQTFPCCHEIKTIIAGVSRVCPGPPFSEYDEESGYPSQACDKLTPLIDSRRMHYSLTSKDFILEVVTNIGSPPEGANAFMLTILTDVLYFGTQYEDDTKLYEVQRKVSPFEAAVGVAVADDVSIRVVEADDEFGFEIVDAILGGVYNNYQGHVNSQNKPIVKWHGYSSYPVNYQKVWLAKLASGEQLSP
eukprot:g6023.t1